MSFRTKKMIKRGTTVILITSSSTLQWYNKILSNNLLTTINIYKTSRYLIPYASILNQTQERSTYFVTESVLQSCTQMYKHPVYTRPANRWSHLQRRIGCQAHPLLSNRLTRNHGVHSCSRNRVETRFVVVIVGTAIFTWKRLRYVEGTRHPEAASVGTGPRSSDGRPVASILHRGGARIATTWANRATARQPRKGNPTIFAAIFSQRFFRTRPSI